MLHFVFAVLLSSLAFPQGVQQPTETKTEISQSATVSESPIEIGKSFRIASKIMESDREINVWLPPGYVSGDKKYPVLYVIDGGLEQDFHHISGLGQLTTINGNFEELIIVGIKTDVRLMELTHKPEDPRYFRTPPKAGKSDQFLNFITKEVIPFVQSRYRVGERSAVIGESLAGLFITEVFLKTPDTFTDYIAISPSLWWDDKALAKAAPELVAAHNDKPRQLYLTMADEGGTMQRGLDMILEAIKNNKPGGLTIHYVDRRKSESHSSIYHGAALDALNKLFGLPQPDYGDPPWYLIEGGQPPDEKKSDK